VTFGWVKLDEHVHVIRLVAIEKFINVPVSTVQHYRSNKVFNVTVSAVQHYRSNKVFNVTVSTVQHYRSNKVFGSLYIPVG
jgi:hypothetical protein